MKRETNSMLKFFFRIIFPAFLAVLFFVIALFYIVIPIFENAMMDRKREMIKELTNTASSILQKYHQDEEAGLISKEDAQQTAIARIQYLKYGEENKDYFWITDMHPNMIMHPYRPYLNNTDLTNYKDSLGRKMFVRSVEIVKEQGHGFIEYMWQWKDDSTQIVPKLSYVKGFEPWNWIVGTGIYIEDVKKDISNLSSRLFYISAIIAIIVAMILLFISIQSLKIERNKQKAEIKLKESREKYRSLVEASTEGLVMISDNRIIFTNAVFLNMVQLSFEELEKLKWQDIFTLPENIIKNLEHGKHDIETEPFETEIHLPGKTKTEVLINITPILFYGKKAVIFSIKDISSDILIKQELFESRERFKSLMDKLEVGIFRTTMDARGRFIEANETALNLLGFKDYSQIKNKYILDFFAEDEDKRSFRKKLLKTCFIKNEVVKIKTTKGKIEHMMVSLAVIPNNKGEAVYCDGIIESFSENKIDNVHQQKQIDAEDFRTLLNSISVKGFEKPIYTISLNQTIKEASQIMEELNHKHLFITDSEKRILGYITNNEIAEGLLKSNNITKLSPAYSIMKSPVFSIPAYTSIISAREMIKRTASQLLIIDNPQEEAKGYICLEDIGSIADVYLSEIFAKFTKAGTIESLAKLRSEFVRFVSKLVDNNISYSIILQLLSDAFDAIISRLFTLSEKEFGKAPVNFAFIVLGSEGRNEQTLNTDQDNAIIYADPDEKDKAEVEKYFLALGKWMSDSLDKIGYSLCKGNNMAMNPRWNKPLSEWKNYFHKWINKGHAKDLLDINIFFDFRLSYGESYLINDLQSYILKVSKSNPAYLHHLAKNTMNFKPSVNFFGNIVVGSTGAPPDTLNLKDNIAALVNFARVYALKNEITQKNTLARLQTLYSIGIINDTDMLEIQHAYEYLSTMRLKHQASQILKNVKPDNYINAKSLTEIEKTTLKKVLSVIGNFLTRLTHDFNLNI